MVLYRFPWEIGKLMPRLDPEYLQKAAGFQGYEVGQKIDFIRIILP